MTRRALLERLSLLAVGGTLSAPLLSGLLAGCRASPPEGSFRPQTLSAEQYDWLGTLSETIIPTTDTPGARDAGVPAFIDGLLTGWYPADERDTFLSGLDALDAHARTTYGAPGHRLNPEQQTELVATLDRQVFGATSQASALPDTVAAFYRKFKELTVVGYYTSEIGATQELQQNPMGVYNPDLPYADIGRAWA